MFLCKIGVQVHYLGVVSHVKNGKKSLPFCTRREMKAEYLSPKEIGLAKTLLSNR